MNPAWIIARREVGESFRETRFWISFVFLGLVLPVFYARTSIVTNEQGIGYFWLLLVMLFPATYSVQTAVVSFVGEKEARTIEPLLAAPLRESQLYLGKVVASVLPPALLSVFSAVCFWTARGALAPGEMIRFNLWPEMFLFVLFIIFFMVGVGVFISARTSSVRAGQQMTAIITVPTLFFVLGRGQSVINGLINVPFLVLGGLLLADVVLLYVGSRFTRRESILNRLG